MDNHTLTAVLVCMYFRVHQVNKTKELIGSLIIYLFYNPLKANLMVAYLDSNSLLYLVVVIDHHQWLKCCETLKNIKIFVYLEYMYISQYHNSFC